MAFFPRTVRALFHPLEGRSPEVAFIDDLANGWGKPAPLDNICGVPLFGGNGSKPALTASSKAVSSGGTYSEKHLDYSASDFGSFE